MRHATMILAAAVSLIVVLTIAIPAAAEDVPPECDSAGGELEASELPTSVDLQDCPELETAEISDDAVSVELPPAGTGVMAHATTDTGTEELQVEHAEDGTVALSKVGDDMEEPAEEPLFQAQALRACGDRAFNLYPWRVEGAFKWKFGRGSTPRGVNRWQAQTEIKRAATAITRSKNDCRMSDRVQGTRSVYEGRTAARAQIDSSARCKSGLDTRSVVSFGRLPSNYLALTCTYYYYDSPRDRHSASDIKINNRKRWSTNRKSCKRQTDLRAVMTHEMGHVWGLDHVGEARHGNLTMSTRPSNGYCDTSARTLGRGDVRGLSKLY